MDTPFQRPDRRRELQRVADAETDRRRYFRVGDELPLYLEAIDDEGVERLLAEMEQETENRMGLSARFAATTSQMDHVLNRIKEHDPDVALYLQSINQKLDVVAKVLLLEGEPVARMRTVNVELSASGLSVDHTAAMDVGQLVRVELLTTATSARILVLGRVIRCLPAPQPNLIGNRFRLAIDFERIGEHDEDLIMQEVMRRQAAILRERRAQQEE